MGSTILVKELLEQFKIARDVFLLTSKLVNPT